MAYEPQTQEERAADIESLRQLSNLLRNPTFRKVIGWAQGRKLQVIEHLGQTGLSSDDRAMLQGKVALLQEIELHLATALVEAAQDANQSTPEDVHDEGRPVPLSTPDLL